MIIGEHTGTVSREFIEARDKHVIRIMREERIKEEDAIRRWDSEFPEQHQCTIDAKQTLFEGNDTHTHHAYDTIDEDYGNCDYKRYSKDGIHISSYIHERCVDGTIDHIVVWQWADRNIHKRLYENDEVSYIILGVVPASQVVKLAKIVGRDHRGRPKYRFPYEKGVK